MAPAYQALLIPKYPGSATLDIAKGGAAYGRSEFGLETKKVSHKHVKISFDRTHKVIQVTNLGSNPAMIKPQDGVAFTLKDAGAKEMHDGDSLCLLPDGSLEYILQFALLPPLAQEYLAQEEKKKAAQGETVSHAAPLVKKVHVPSPSPPPSSPPPQQQHQQQSTAGGFISAYSKPATTTTTSSSGETTKPSNQPTLFDMMKPKKQQQQQQPPVSSSSYGDGGAQTTSSGGGYDARAPSTTVTTTSSSSGFSLSEVTGDLFSSPDSLCHCISADVRMGKGIADIFRKKFGGVQELTDQHVPRGGCAYLQRSGRYIYYLITKEKYYSKPSYEDLCRSLEEMKKLCEKHGVSKISMPRIGCGLDGLSWKMVSEHLRDIFKNTNIQITVYSL